MKKVLVLEDNKRTCDMISQIIYDTCELVEVYSIEEVGKAYKCALENTIDLFIVDIILDTSVPGDISGIRFVDSIRQIQGYQFVPVIIVTSLEDPKLYSYEELHCYGYIEKPFDPERIKKLVLECMKFSDGKVKKQKLYFRKDGILVSVNRDAIVYVESINHVAYFHMVNNDTLDIPYLTLKNFLKTVDSDDFIQCSRQCVVNEKYISSVDSVNRYITLTEDKGILEIGIMFKKRLRGAS
ncbi:MAG: LytTR family DNA-binding domain-containing protein [Lachnospiraceae bacterium]|nr:LytTR family DNA-binding domain-containing protein [Lachnospiraceae bacterium]